MSRPTPPVPLAPPAPELVEILRQSLAGLAPPDPMAWLIDRLEGRR
jgi:hypothetical protein